MIEKRRKFTTLLIIILINSIYLYYIYKVFHSFKQEDYERAENRVKELGWKYPQAKEKLAESKFILQLLYIEFDLSIYFWYRWYIFGSDRNNRGWGKLNCITIIF